jgi:NADH-quinone oxidoreductase subunit D
MSTIIPIGPYHPLLEEPELFRLHVEGEKVVGIDVRMGYNHRGIERLAQDKTYDQVLFLVERVCGICSTSHPIAFCNAVEDMAGIQIPERAAYIRVIIAELERLHSHLLWLGLAGHYIGYHTLWMWTWKYREPILDIFEMVTGNRQSYAMMKVGGVRRDIPSDAVPVIRKVMGELESKVRMLAGTASDDPVIAARLKGVGRISKEDAAQYCLLGPSARSAGLDMDVRRDAPYAAYGKLDFRVITQAGGDVFAVTVVRVLEMLESIKLIRQCLDDMPAGPVAAEVAQLPVGEGIGTEEAPRGECFHYVRSDGSNNPVRVKIRAPSYMNVPSFKARVLGGTISDAAIILASVDPCYSCTERMITVDPATGRPGMSAADLIRLSQQKTVRLMREMGRSEADFARKLAA